MSPSAEMKRWWELASDQLHLFCNVTYHSVIEREAGYTLEEECGWGRPREGCGLSLIKGVPISLSSSWNCGLCLLIRTQLWGLARSSSTLDYQASKQAEACVHKTILDVHKCYTRDPQTSILKNSLLSVAAGLWVFALAGVKHLHERDYYHHYQFLFCKFLFCALNFPQKASVVFQCGDKFFSEQLKLITQHLCNCDLLLADCKRIGSCPSNTRPEWTGSFISSSFSSQQSFAVC